MKGVSARELVGAVHVMRELSVAHPAAMGYRGERGHSLILWSPWTSLEDLEASLGTIRSEGLRELFWDLGRNRLRLTHELPITRAAERDGALTTEWPAGEEGAARRKGYSPEQPWRFLDARTALAHRLAEALRERLGRETELAQLRASVALARSTADLEGAFTRTMEDLARLEEALARWLRGERASDAPPRSAFLRAAVVDLGMPCSCGRHDCAERDAWVSPERASVRLAEALAARPEAVLLAGGDAAAHPALAALLALARGRAPTGLAMPAPRAVPALPVDALVLDARAVAGIAPLASGVEHARDASGGRPAIEVRILLSAELDARRAGELTSVIDQALAPDVLRVVVPLDGVGLDRLAEARRALSAIASEAGGRGLALEVSPLSAGPAWRERFPVRRPR